MPRFVALLILPLIAMSAPAAAAAQERDAASRELIRAMVDERNAREQARKACADEGELRERVLAGTANPVAEAHAAAARGCFGLVNSYNAVPIGIAYGIGVACRPNQQLFSYGRLQLLSVSGSDVPAINAEEAEQRSRIFGALRDFGLSYNRAVLAHPAFPHRDLCRVAADDYSPELGEELRPGEWGYRGLDETDVPLDMSEAARRGTLQSLRRLIKARPIDMYVPDVLGLTPLAWAVIYGRHDHVRLLLEAGAHPYGQPYWDRPVEKSPITIAREERNRAMIRELQPAVIARGLEQPAIEPRLDRARSSPYLLRIDPQRSYAGTRLVISPEGRVTSCQFEAASGGTEADCDRARRGLLYLPAEDEGGRPQQSSAFIYLPVVGRR